MSAEVMSACENVCRDFSWLDGSGRFVVPAVIASVTALIIAFKAYPWQKAKDRDLEIQTEKRKVYVEFLKAASAWDPQQGELLRDLEGKPVKALSDAMDGILVYAPTEVANLCFNYIMSKTKASATASERFEITKALGEKMQWKIDEVRDESAKVSMELIRAMRKDTGIDELNQDETFYEFLEYLSQKGMLA